MAQSSLVKNRDKPGREPRKAPKQENKFRASLQELGAGRFKPPPPRPDTTEPGLDEMIWGPHGAKGPQR